MEKQARVEMIQRVSPLGERPLLGVLFGRTKASKAQNSPESGLVRDPAHMGPVCIKVMT